MNTYKLYRDRKNTVWDRCFFTVEAETLEEAIQLVIEDEVFPNDSEIVYDTLEWMLPSKGESTEEVFDDNDDLVYSNKPKSK